MTDRRLLAALALLSCTIPIRALGADRVILGTRLAVEDRSTPDRRRIQGSGKESATDVPALSDPRVGGATLTVFANGATDSTGTFILDATGWTVRGSGYRYGGPTGPDGDPVKRVIVKRTSGGSAAITIMARGDIGTQRIDVVPPNRATTGGFILDVAGGDRYCVQLGGLAGGTTRADDARRWDVRKGTAEPGCPTSDTTTTTTMPPVCGNGIREGREDCDGSDLRPDCAALRLYGCFPAGDPHECECCVGELGDGDTTFFYPLCCDGATCQLVAPGHCRCPGAPGTCGGSPFPTCGGSCEGSTVCAQVQFGALLTCACAPPGPCDGTCHGAECPAGEVCSYRTCTCVVP